ncbi:trehalose-phosphatase [Propioniciclava soli]|uniref:Trehalose 6-phosphate phosphatase n=1 Tax=Propioniciclava soli TaxID=2775081 RepID=A0ABZ3C8B6_9ACTN
MHITSDAGRAAWSAIVADPASTLVCSDFDGVLSPIVPNPDEAWASEATLGALERLGGRVAKVAVVTGRPARQAVRLGRLDARDGLGSASVLGLYGFERWDAGTGAFDEPEAPAGVAEAAAELPALLAGLDLSGARIEYKRLSVGVHTRELPDPAGAFERLTAPLAELAGRHGLQTEPGRLVMELRARGLDKGDAIHRLVDEVEPTTIMYAGDDLGDLPAFRAVRDLRDSGRVKALLICSGSDEQDALVAVSDVVVDGPDGVAALWNALADELAG